jgi:presenilin-like A22 family membrane protease
VGVNLIKVVGDRSIIEIIAIFTVVLLAGMLVSIAAVKTSSISIIYNTLSNPRFADLSYVIDATLVLIVSLLILRRHTHHSNTMLFEALEAIVISFTSFFFFLLVFATLMPQCVASGYIYVYSAVLALMLVLLKDRYHRLRDLATMVSSIGVGLILGLNFAFGWAMLILALVAVYDYVGVFKSDEMITLAKAVSTNDLSFLLSVSDLEAVPKWGLNEKEIEDYMNYLANVHELDDPRFKKILQKGELPVISQISLGEGDLSLPLMAAVSAYFTLGPLMGMVVALGAIVGAIATMLILREYKHPIPAVPPLFAFIGIFAGTALIFTKAPDWYYFGALLIVASAVTMLIDILTITRRMHGNRVRKQAAAPA